MADLKDILVTGVSAGENQQPYADLLGKLTGFEAVLFDPDKYFDDYQLGAIADAKGKITGMAYDVIAYALFPEIRAIIDGHLDRMVDKYKPRVQHGHSLGSEILFHAAHRGHKIPYLITYGSPAWYPLIWNFIDMSRVAKNVGVWINYWSPTDIVAAGAGKMKKYCKFNRMVISGHELDLYFKQIIKTKQGREWLKKPENYYPI